MRNQKGNNSYILALILLLLSVIGGFSYVMHQDNLAYQEQIAQIDSLLESNASETDIYDALILHQSINNKKYNTDGYDQQIIDALISLEEIQDSTLFLNFLRSKSVSHENNLAYQELLIAALEEKLYSLNTYAPELESQLHQGYKKRIELSPTHTAYYVEYADFLTYVLKKPKQGMSYYRDAVEQDESSANAWYALGVALSKQENNDDDFYLEAFSALKTSVQLEDNYEHYLDLGNFVNERMRKLFSKELARGVSLPYNSPKREELEEVYGNTHIDSFKKAIEMDPERSEAYYYLADTYASLADITHYGLGSGGVRQGVNSNYDLYSLAKDNLEIAYKKSPDEPGYAMAFGSILYKFGGRENLTRALEIYSKVSKGDDEENSSVLNNIAVLSLELGGVEKLQSAIEMIEKSIKNESFPSSVIQQNYLALLLQEGSVESAKKAIKAGIDSISSMNYGMLGQALKIVGATETANILLAAERISWNSDTRYDAKGWIQAHGIYIDDVSLQNIKGLYAIIENGKDNTKAIQTANTYIKKKVREEIDSWKD